MGISFGSINTGLPKDIVQQIIAAEKIPLEKMEVRKSNIAEKKKLVTELISLMENIRENLIKNASSKDLRELQVDTNNELIDVTVDKNLATPGTYRFEVGELAQKSSAMTSGFSNKDDSYVGVGYIQYSLPNGETREIYVDQENSSLTKIAQLINRDESNGLKATVVNDGSGSSTPWRIIVSLEETGDENLAEFPYFYFVDGEDDLFLEFEREAHDAKVKLDGFEIEASDNKIKDVIPGVTIDLKKAKPGEEFTINISEDQGAITEKMQSFFESINEVLKFIKIQNSLDENSDTSRTLGGDLVLQTLESRIRQCIFQEVKTAHGPSRIGNLGIAFQRDGLLQFNDKIFTSQVSKNYQMVSQTLTGIYLDGQKHPGFIDNLRNVIDTSLNNPAGILQSRKKAFQNTIDQIDRRIADRQRILEQKEKNLKEKFARLEGTISKIRSQGAGISALAGNAINPVQQLGQ